ncbi:MAG: hypothetical protein ACRDR6_09845 [Pseudonocardiaceae bacterium]
MSEQSTDLRETVRAHYAAAATAVTEGSALSAIPRWVDKMGDSYDRTDYSYDE